jgi:amidase
MEVEGFKATAGMLRFKENVSKGDCNGRTNHPKFNDKTCGGSSGGGACSVALGISDIDIGNDFMGSIRIPAHFCGIYGLIGTDDTIPLDKIVGGKPYGSTMTKILRAGFQAASLFDLEYVFNIISNIDKVLTPKVLQDKLRIAYTASAGGLMLSAEYTQLYHKYIAKLSKDHNLVEVKDNDFDFEKARKCFLGLLYSNITITLPPVIRFLARYIGGKPFMTTNLKHYLETEEIREKCIEQLESLLGEFDVLLSPVCSMAAFEHQTPAKMQGEQAVYRDLRIDDKRVSYAAATMGYTTPFSLTSSPVVTIPIGRNSIGLPMGVQVVGRRNREYDLLQSTKVLCKYE